MSLYPTSNGSFINKFGEIIIPPRSNRRADIFIGNRAVAGYYKNDKLKGGFINGSGEWAIDPVYDFVYPFRDGVAIVGYQGDAVTRSKEYIIDQYGNVLWELPPDIKIGGHWGMQTPLLVIKNNKCAYATSTGTFITDFEFTNAKSFSDDVGIACLGESNEGKTKWRMIQKDGSTLLNFVSAADEVYSYTEGFARLRYRRGNEDFYHYLNKKGEVMNKTPFSIAGPFSEGRAYVKGGGQGPGVWYVNKQFECVLKPSFKFSLNNFSSGLVVVRDNINNLYGYSDVLGRNVIPCLYSDHKTMQFTDELAFVVQTDKYNGSKKYLYINKLGETVYRMEREIFRLFFH